VARKKAFKLKSRQRQAQDSWACVGCDTSLSSIAVCGLGYDAILGKMTPVLWAEKRWTDEHYYTRLRDAVKGVDLVRDVLARFWVLDPELVHVALEEPFYFGAVRKGQSGYLKQQAEISGAFKAGLLLNGFNNIYEINNSQWYAVLRRDGVEFKRAEKGASEKTKRELKLANKFMVKEWAMQAYGLPDLPDLVKTKAGGKIPRPESGFGANAQAIQPDDTYDAAAILAWMVDNLKEAQ
jgi:hypothetical protein